MNPFLPFLLLLVGIPLLELYFLIQVGSLIGALPTLLLSIGTAVLGATLMRHQGFATAMRVRSALERGETPAMEMLEGVVVFIAGAILLFPGFLTDLLGILALIPPLRRAALRRFIRRVDLAPAGTSSGFRPRHHGNSIEGECQRLDD